MDIIYSNHAQEKIDERKISKRIIENALMHPDSIINSRAGTRIAHNSLLCTPGKIYGGKMKISYDPEVDAMNIKFQSGKYSISNEIADGIIVDYTEDGRVISIEILDASKKIPLKNIRDITIALPVDAITERAVASISD